MYTVLNYIRPFEGNRETDVAPSENEFDTPVLRSYSEIVSLQALNLFQYKWTLKPPFHQEYWLFTLEMQQPWIFPTTVFEHWSENELQ